MEENLYFEPNWYRITKLISPNVLEIEGTWFIKLKGIEDNTPKEELDKWLEEGYIVRIIPHWRNEDARIVSDVWLGNTHINRQFPAYIRDNLIQLFDRWSNIKENQDVKAAIKAEEKLIDAFNTAWDSIPRRLRKTVSKWIDCNRQISEAALKEIDGILEIKKQRTDQMIKEFNNWRRKQK